MKKFRYLAMVLLVALVAIGCEDQFEYQPTPPNTEEGEKPNPDDGNGNGQTPGDEVTPEFDENGDYPLISTIPAFVTESMTDDVLVIVNGTGTTIDGFTGDLYAHTGVITDKSTVSSDWKYTKAQWTENKPECKLAKHANNLWTLTIKGGPRAYYGVPESETIESLAFVFRSADGTKELKKNNNDIFIDLATEGLSVMFVSPINGTLYEVGDNCAVQVKAKGATSLTLYKNGEQVASTDTSTIEYNYTATAAEDIVFRAEATDGTTTVEESVTVAVLGQTENATRPANAKGGVTIDGTSATFTLYAPGKQSVILLGDFNNYAPTNQHMMKRDGDYFWVTVDGLQSGVEYGYQYLVDGTIKIGDPYAEKILDPWNDQWITATTYPDLKKYPAEYTTDIVSVFDIDDVEYQWQVPNFDRPAENSLAVYELLIRDFTTERTIDAVTAKLDYLEGLGINAVQLMPIQEFDGNDSWGYNPCFYFAADKAYGTEEAYKRFIDECHKRGIAVILDVVFNHATGQFPYAKMWWDSSKNCTAASNPFFNVTAKHNFNVYHDFNHTYQPTRDYFKEVLKFWLEEYNVDGFRFDLTKGFVQNPSNFDAWDYSAERIGILKDYANAIRAVEQDAYIIFEHFCSPAEEEELYTSVGALCWNNNQLEGYSETVMGWYDDGNSGDGSVYTVIGDLQGGNWTLDVPLNLQNGIYVAQDVIFANANKEGCVFKIRVNRGWDISYGVSNGSTLHNLRTGISLNGSANINMNVEVGVKYDIYFDKASMMVYVMPDGEKPAHLSTRRLATRAGGNKTNFADFKRGRMNNIETHDEERIAYKAITYGQDWVKNDWAVISKRLQAIYAFHFLTPYPKMLWQFGELGYDFSINSNESGVVGSSEDYRTHRKPVRWDYAEDTNRKAVYNAISKVLNFRTSREDIYGVDNIAVHTWNVGDNVMGGKTLVMDNVIMVANFTNATVSTTVNVPVAGEWTNLMTDQKVSLSGSYTATLAANDYIIFVR